MMMVLLNFLFSTKKWLFYEREQEEKRTQNSIPYMFFWTDFFTRFLLQKYSYDFYDKKLFLKSDIGTFIRLVWEPVKVESEKCFSRTNFRAKSTPSWLLSSKLHDWGHATMPLCSTRPHELTKPALSTLLYNHRRSSTALLFAKSIKVSSDPREKKAVLGSRMGKVIHESLKKQFIYNLIFRFCLSNQYLMKSNYWQKSIVSKMSIQFVTN